MVKTVIITGTRQTQVQDDLNEFWKKHDGVGVQLLAQSSSECYISPEGCWSLTVVLTVKIG